MRILILVAAMALAGCASQPKAPSAWNKAGVERTAFEVDLSICDGRANAMAAPPPTNSASRTPVSDALVGSAALLIGMNLADQEFADCMVQRGYRRTWLTPEELVEVRSLLTDEQNADWRYRFASTPRPEETFVDPDAKASPQR
jgi:uncharacterized lipoprotein YajG